MGMLTKGLGYLGSNLGGIFGKKWVMAIIFTLISTMGLTIYTFQNQKENLREEKSELYAQLSKEQAQHVAEIERITVKNNQIILNSINDEEVARLKSQLESEKIKSKIELEENKKLNDRLKAVELFKNDDYFTKCIIPEAVKNILNKGKNKQV